MLITWAGGEHEFALRIEHLRALQDKCDAGPMHVLQRLSTGQWLVDDVLQPIRIGLEGGGLEKAEAIKLVRRHVEDLPITRAVLLAQAVLQSALFGPGDDPAGESPSGEGIETRSPEEKFAGPA